MTRELWMEHPGGLRLHARRWEHPRAAAIVGIVHGLGDHSGRFERVARALVARGFQVEAVDLPGHGRSSGPRGHVGSWIEYRDAVSLWLERSRCERPELPWALLGQSLGALVVLDWAFASPSSVRALILGAPPFELAIRPSMAKVYAAQLMARVWPRFAQETSIAPTMLSHDPEVIAAHRADPLVHYRMSARLFLEFTLARRTLARRAAAVEHPTFVIQGGADPITSAAGTARWVGSATPSRIVYRELPGLYHEVLNETAGPALLEEIAAWLTETLRD